MIQANTVAHSEQYDIYLREQARERCGCMLELGGPRHTCITLLPLLIVAGQCAIEYAMRMCSMATLQLPLAATWGVVPILCEKTIAIKIVCEIKSLTF